MNKPTPDDFKKMVTACRGFRFAINSAKASLTVGGTVSFPGGYMHPESFRKLCGEKAWKELLKRPRIVCEYD